MRACWLKWVGRDWSISADYIWLNYSDANITSSVKSVMGITSHQMEGSARHEGCRQQGRFYQSG